MGYEYQEYPKTLYRKDETGSILGKTFARAEDVLPGWQEASAFPGVSLSDAPREAPAPAKPPPPPADPGEAAKLKASVDLLQADLDAANRALGASQKLAETQAELIGEYNAFVAEVAESDDFDAIKARARDLNSAASPSPAKQKKKAKA